MDCFSTYAFIPRAGTWRVGLNLPGLRQVILRTNLAAFTMIYASELVGGRAALRLVDFPGSLCLCQVFSAAVCQWILQAWSSYRARPWRNPEFSTGHLKRFSPAPKTFLPDSVPPRYAQHINIGCAAHIVANFELIIVQLGATPTGLLPAYAHNDSLIADRSALLQSGSFAHTSNSFASTSHGGT